MGWSKEPAPAGSLPRVHAQQSRRQEGLEVWRHTPLCLCGLRSLMGEFIILHTSVGRVGSARSFSLGVRTHPQRDVSGLPSSETRGAEGPEALTVSHPRELSPGRCTQRLHVAAASPGLTAAGLEKPPKSEFKRLSRSYHWFKTQPPKPQNISSALSSWWRKHCGLSTFAAGRTRIHSFPFLLFLLHKLWKCDETWEIQSDIQLYCILQKITMYYCIL